MTAYRTALATILAVGLGLGAASAANAQTLARKAMLGVAIEAAAGGAKILTVAPNSTAAAAGLQAGDVIVSMNGAPVADHAALVGLADKLRAGEDVSLIYTRGGQSMTAQASATPRPVESYTNASATYGAVPFEGGLLRDIMVKPANAKADGAVVYLIQGYYCATMEAPNPASPYHMLAQGLADRGIATYRVEKPGMGDSQGGPSCFDTDFDTELAAFRTGLKTLIETHGVDPSRIVILGHSMGGVQAPLLAAETQGLRGVAVYGTVLRSWHDYMQDLFRLQAFYSVGADPVEAEDLAEAMRPLLDAIYMTDAPLSEVAVQVEHGADLLEGALDWDGGEMILGRTAAYWRGVGQQRLALAWRDANAPTLAVYGEVDYAAIDDRDHKQVVEVVNYYRPGTATYATLPKTGHGMGIEGAPKDAQAANRAAGGQQVNTTYNTDLTKVLGDWIASLPKT